jgi:hypothetical protein
MSFLLDFGSVIETPRGLQSNRFQAVTKSTTAAEDRLDELYREHPDGFVAGRNALAKELRAAGERDEAERVKKLRRPSAAAWLINRAALTSPKELAEFGEASHALEEAQTRALEGDDDGAAAWRAAAERERDAAAAVVDAARTAAAEAGHKAGQRALELVDATLRAAAANPELREQVLRGRVEREQSAATLGTSALAPMPDLDRGAAKRQAAARARREATQAQRELERLEGELSDAEAHQERMQAQVDQTTETLKHAKSKLADAKRQTAKLKRQVRAAQRRAAS